MSAADLDCETFQSELPDLVYGELDPEARPGVEAHLASCAACAELTRELRAVRRSLPEVQPPPLLTSRVKLAARDELLARRRAEEGAAEVPPPHARGGALHWVAVLVLGVCLTVVGFALGVLWERDEAPPTRDEEPSLPVPDAPADVDEPAEAWEGPPDASASPRAPRAPDAWQRVLYDAGSEYLASGQLDRARDFFRRADGVSPRGPLAAAARVGIAEAVLRQGDPDRAGRMLRQVRAEVLAGELAGGPALLQRIHELQQEAEGGD